MTITRLMSAGRDQSDAELVALTLAGSHDSFARIVARYQSLVCALAYSACGNLSRSEDLAQEVFIIAWRELRHLRTPERLRSWLCAIARNHLRTSFRKQHREPILQADPIDESAERESMELSPSAQAINEEEETILWRSLEKIPDDYRETLILYYREQQSVRQVAESMDISEEAVKKRLIRGRQMLQEEVTTFVEGALQRTGPGKAFTLAVITALPLMAASSATAATVGAMKAGTAAKTAAGLGLGAAAAGAVLGVLGAVGGMWASVHNTHSPRERRFMIRQIYVITAFITVFLAALLALIFFGRPLAAYSRVAFGCALGGLIVLYCVGLTMLILKSNRRQKQIRIEDGTEARLNAERERHAEVELKPTKGQVYGSLGGSTIGALSWMVIQSARLQQWSTVATVVVFGALVLIVSTRASFRRPERFRRINLQTIAALGIFTVIICAVHWRDWIASLQR